MNKNSRRLRIALLLFVAAGTGVSFQNCGQQFAIEDELASTAIDDIPGTIVEDHEDRDPGHEDPDTLTEKAYVEAESAPILPDRRLMDSILNDIFGPNYVNLEGGRIRSNAADFGMPCSLYEDYRIRRASDNALVSAGPLFACRASNTDDAVTAPISPSPGVKRQANLIQTCNALVSNATTRAYALQRIQGGTGVPSPTEENMLKAFRLFYRSKPDPHQALLQSLQIMMPGGTGVTAADWAPVLYTLCISPGWQLL